MPFARVTYADGSVTYINPEHGGWLDGNGTVRTLAALSAFASLTPAQKAAIKVQAIEPCVPEGDTAPVDDLLETAEYDFNGLTVTVTKTRRSFEDIKRRAEPILAGAAGALSDDMAEEARVAYEAASTPLELARALRRASRLKAS